MATETYKWFQPDTNLRSDYGGGAAQAFGDSREVPPYTLTHRWVCKKLGYPANGVSLIWELGTASTPSAGSYWIRVPDLIYASVSPWLSSAELATVTSTIPTGWVKQSITSIITPNPNRFNLLIRGDSLKFGAGTTTGDTRDTWPAQLINSIAGETISWLDASYTEGQSNNYRLMNLSLGGSNWANVVETGVGSAAYPLREDLAWSQRTKTLSLVGRKTGFIYALGSNDGAYDTSITATDIWNRALTRIQAFQAEFPNIKLGMETVYKRTTNSALKARLNDYNNLIRTNAPGLGIRVFDSESKVSQLSIATGDTTNRTYYVNDDIHITTPAHTLIAVSHKQDVIDWLAAA